MKSLSPKFTNIVHFSAPPAPTFEPNPFPPLLNLQLLSRIAFAALIFGRAMDPHYLATLAVVYYLYEVGMVRYVYRRMYPQRVAAPEGTEGPGQDQGNGGIVVS
jgi:hypothetical protein